MGVAADMMTRPLFMAIMITSWMCIPVQCDSCGLGVAVNCSYIPESKSVTCTVDYSEAAVPGNCKVTSSFLNDIHNELIMNGSNGSGREGLSFDVRNVQEGEYKVFVRTTCGEPCAFISITIPGEIASLEGSPGSPASLRTHSSCVIVGFSVVVIVVFFMLGILKPKRLCSR